MLIPSGSFPLDNRVVVANVEDLENPQTFYIDGAFSGYSGMVVLVKDSDPKLFAQLSTDLSAKLIFADGGEEIITYPVKCAYGVLDMLGYPTNKLKSGRIKYCYEFNNRFVSFIYELDESDNYQIYKVVYNSDGSQYGERRLINQITDIKYGTWLQLTFPNEDLPDVPVIDRTGDIERDVGAKGQPGEQKTFASTGSIKRYIDNSLSWNKYKTK